MLGRGEFTFKGLRDSQEEVNTKWHVEKEFRKHCNEGGTISSFIRLEKKRRFPRSEKP